MFTKSYGKITLEDMPVTGEDPNNCLLIQSWQVTVNYCSLHLNRPKEMLIRYLDICLHLQKISNIELLYLDKDTR